MSGMIEHILNTKVNGYDDAMLLNYMIRDMRLLIKVEDAWGEKTIREVCNICFGILSAVFAQHGTCCI